MNNGRAENGHGSEHQNEKVGVLVFPLTEECKLFVEGGGKNPFLNLNSKMSTTTATILKHILFKLFHVSPSDQINNRTKFFNGAPALTATLIVANEDRTAIVHAFPQGSAERPTCAMLLGAYPHILEKDTNKIKLFFNFAPSDQPLAQAAVTQQQQPYQYQEERQLPPSSSSNQGTPPKGMEKIQYGDPQLSPITPRPGTKQAVENGGFGSKQGLLVGGPDFGDGISGGGGGGGVGPFDLPDVYNSRASLFGYNDERSLTSLFKEENEKRRQQVADESSFFVGSHKVERTTMFSQLTFGGATGTESFMEPHSKIVKYD